jgi:hypothetical protein
MLFVPTICSLAYRSEQLASAHPNYARLLKLACECHAGGRNPERIGAADVDLARLYTYAFRRQVIGVFHATRVALEALPAPTDGEGAAHRLRARELLADLANLSMDAIPRDFRALLGPFYRYETHLGRVIDALRADAARGGGAPVERIAARFTQLANAVRQGNGIELTRDTEAPEQASFVVPNLGITIVPLVYGDFHSWNLAWLDGERSDVPFHRHGHGVEIHLGFSPLRGHIVFDRSQALTDEGYALPIPPGKRHGYVNASERVHHLPFLFGSVRRGGWGIFFDVTPDPIDLDKLQAVERTSGQLNNPVMIEREIRRMTEVPLARRVCILPATRTSRDGNGGLALHLARAPKGKPMTLAGDRFLAVSVVHGEGRLRMAGQEATIRHHDHFGIPAGIAAQIEQVGETPLVLMDADLVP